MADLRTPWRAASAAMFLNGFILGTWAARVPAVMAHHGLATGGFGLFLLLMGIGALLSFPLAGRLVDRHGPAAVVRVTMCWLPVTLILVGLLPGYLGLGIAIFLFGSAHGAMDVAMNSWAAEVERHMRRSVMSSIHAMWSFGAGGGAAFGFLMVALGTSAPLHFAIAAVVIFALCSWFVFMPWNPPRRAVAGAAPAFALPRGPLLLVGVLALSSGIGEGAMADWSAVFLDKVAGVSHAQATLGYAVYSITMVLMRLTADLLVTRLGPVVVARAGGLVAALGIAIATLLPGFWTGLIGFGLMGIGYATLMPLAISRAANDPDVSPGRAIASIATLGYGALLLGPPVIGQLAAMGSLTLAFQMLGAFALLVAVIAPVLSLPGQTAAGEGDEKETAPMV